MITQKRIQLIQRLLAFTKNGEISWSMVDDDCISGQFGNITVEFLRIEKDFASNSTKVEVDYAIDLKVGGRTVDSFSDPDVPFHPQDWTGTGASSPFDAMKQIFEMARFTAEGAAGAYDELFAILQPRAA